MVKVNSGKERMKPENNRPVTDVAILIILIIYIYHKSKCYTKRLIHLIVYTGIVN